MRAIVTGASSGIGWHLALGLAMRGAHVLATARREERLRDLLAEWELRRKNSPGGSLTISIGDITSADHRKRLMRQCEQQWNGLDILVNNAGAGAIGAFADASPDRLRRVMEVDFFACVELTRIAIPLLRNQNRPAILVIGSVLGHRGVPRKSEYCAAKFAIRGWTESLRSELVQDNIDVVLVSPSTTRSEFFDSLIATHNDEKSKSVGSMSPEQVAIYAIQALEKGRREVILSIGGKLLVLFGKCFPRTLDRILAKYS